MTNKLNQGKRFAWLCLALLASLSVAAHAVTPEGAMGHQETVVRSAYAKLAYAAKQRAVLVVAKDELLPVKDRKLDAKGIDALLTASEVTFTLKDFVVGNVSDILDKKVMTLIGPPQDFVLRSFLQEWNFTESGGKPQPCSGLDLRWERNNNPPGEESANLKFDGVYRLQWGVERPNTAWQTYANYTVTVTFQAKTQGPYRAMFIFGYDENGNQVVEPADQTTDNAALAEALHESLFPAALVSTRLRANPTAASWIAVNQMADSSCSVGKGDVCCDLNTLKCGAGRVDVSSALSQRIEGEK
jgi:hypothetical protein